MLIGKYPFLPRLRSERIGGPNTKTISVSNFRAACAKCQCQWETKRFFRSRPMDQALRISDPEDIA